MKLVRKTSPLVQLFARWIAVMIAAVSLTACGFTPLYGNRSTANSPEVVDAMATVTIRSIPNRQGVKLRQVLRENMQPRGVTAPVYDLEVSLTLRTEELGIRPDATASRDNLYLVATFKLNKGGAAVFTDHVQSIVSYDILDDQFATVAAQADAETRGIKQVGDEITTRIAVYFHDHAKVASTDKK
jgi:LPS-assembly lipoprotein